MPKQLSQMLREKIVDQIQTMRPPGMYWEHDDHLSPGQINKLLALPDGLAEVEMEIVETIGSCLDCLQMDYVRAVVKDSLSPIAQEMGTEEELMAEADLDSIIEENGFLDYAPAVDLDIRQLIRNSSARVVLQLNLFHRHEGWQWPNTVCYEDVAQALQLFNINPRQVHPDFPDRPKRNGKEYLDPSDLKCLWDNATYGGQYVMPIDLDLWDYHLRRNCYHTGIILHKGSEIWMHDYFNGAGSVSIPLKRDLLIWKRKLSFYFGDDKKTAGYGLDQVYGLCQSAWSNTIAPVTLATPAAHALPNARTVAKAFIYGNVISDFQFSRIIRPFHDYRERFHGQIPAPGEMMEWDIEHAIWNHFPSAAKVFLRNAADKQAFHLVVKIRELMGQVELKHCQFIVDDTAKRVVWSRVNESPRSWTVFQLIKDAIESGKYNR